MKVRKTRQIMVRRAPGRPCQARVQLANSVRHAALGRAGIRALKREGDGGTPPGRFSIRQVLYRTGRIARPRTPLPVRAIRAADVWCDDPTSANYNRLIQVPGSQSVERLTRADNLYDVVLVLGYNDVPRVRWKGSAIFMHLARPGYAPTEGCIALTQRDLIAVLNELRAGSAIVVEP